MFEQGALMETVLDTQIAILATFVIGCGYWKKEGFSRRKRLWSMGLSSRSVVNRRVMQQRAFVNAIFV